MAVFMVVSMSVRSSGRHDVCRAQVRRQGPGWLPLASLQLVILLKGLGSPDPTVAGYLPCRSGNRRRPPAAHRRTQHR